MTDVKEIYFKMWISFFSSSEWLCKAMKLFIYYLILSDFPVVCTAGPFIVYGCSLAHCFCIIVSVTDWACLGEPFDLWRLDRNCLSHRVSITAIDFSFPLITLNVSDWFSLTKLAVPSEIDLKLLLVREGAQNVLNRKDQAVGPERYFLDWLGECMHSLLEKKCKKVYRAA